MPEPDTQRPIILIEDDHDDQYIFKDVIKDQNLEHPVICFDDCIQAYEYLITTTDRTFIIFCDLNLPKMSGLEFKEQVDKNPQLRRKSIPFVFYSTSVSQQDVNKAYAELNVQGFFKKASDLKEMRVMLQCIIHYWEMCSHPNV